MAIKIQYSSTRWGGSGVERMLDQLARERQNESCAWSPAVDVFETSDSVVLVAEIAGVPHKEMRIIIDGDVVRIYGEREPTCCKGGGRYHRMEIESGSFVRSFRISVPFETKKVRAHVEHGLLYVVLPKTTPETG